LSERSELHVTVSERSELHVTVSERSELHVPVSERKPPVSRHQLVCSSANPDKVAEIAAIVGDVVDLLPRPGHIGEVVEDADTLEGNARLKAVALVQATGRPAVADDTGLFVDALDGAPGVYSARYAGEQASYAENRTKLLAALDGAPAGERTATFRTVALVRWPDGRELSVEGTCAGTIARQERGERGFGYDSVFVPAEGDGRSFAEMTDAEKHALSHRGRAFRALVPALRSVSP
jgi:XTP/dITP diphosphohydrolase